MQILKNYFLLVAIVLALLVTYTSALPYNEASLVERDDTAIPDELAKRQCDEGCQCQPQFPTGEYCGTCAGSAGFVVYELDGWPRLTTVFQCIEGGGCCSLGYRESCNVTYTPCGPGRP